VAEERLDEKPSRKTDDIPELPVTLTPQPEEERPANPPRDFPAAQRLAILTLYAVLASLTFPAIAKAGSAENYLLEPLAAVAVMLASVMGYAMSESANTRRIWSSRLAAVVLVALTFLHANWLLRGDFGGLRPWMALFGRQVPLQQEGLDAARQLLREVDRANGPVVAEDPVFLTLNVRRPVINPFIMKQLAQEGMWDQSPFVDDIADRRFPLIVTTEDFNTGDDFARYTREMVEAIRENYRLADQYDLGVGGQVYFVYRPKPRNARVMNVVGVGLPSARHQES